MNDEERRKEIEKLIAEDKGSPKSSKLLLIVLGIIVIAAIGIIFVVFTGRSSTTTTTTLQTATTVPETERPDVTPDSLSLSPQNPTAGDEITFSGIMKNVGGGKVVAGSNAITLFRIDIDNKGSWNIINDLDPLSSEVEAGANIVLSWGTWTAIAGIHKFQICVDANNTVNELDEGNNCSEQTFIVS